MQTLPRSSNDGFTLLETVVATGVLVTALAGLAQLFALTARSTRDAGAQGAVLTAAQDKIERLRALALGYGPLGQAITDPALAVADTGSLGDDTDGFVDYLGADGAVVDIESDGHGAAWTRRWRITLIDAYAPEALAIEVCVFPYPADGLSPRAAQVCLATVRTRQP